MELSYSDKLKQRVIRIKPNIPKRGHKKIIIEAYPEYNTAEGAELITRVINLRAADEKLTECLESLFSTTTTK